MNEKKAGVEARLNNHPILKARIEALLDIAENTSGKLDLADDAEEQLIVEVQKMGRELLQTWAMKHNEKKFQEARDSSEKVIVHSKKKFIGNQHSAK